MTMPEMSRIFQPARVIGIERWLGGGVNVRFRNMRTCFDSLYIYIL